MAPSSRYCWRSTTLAGCVVNALFCEQENTRSYLLLMRDLIRSYGIPLALYADRHGVFKHTPPPETAAGDRRRSHPVLARYG